jgi:DNA-binding SARP family transcriptional activator
LVRSRIQMQQRETTRAMALSTSVLATVDPGSSESDYALLNIAALHMQAGSVGDSLRIAEQLRDTTSDEHLRMIARGMSLLIAASRTGDLVALSNHLSEMAAKQRGIYPHFFGVTMLNLALVATLRDRPNDAIGLATEAIDALEGTSSRIELAAAHMARGVAQAHLGALQEAEVSVERAAAYDEIETQYERGDLTDSLLNPLDAEAHIEALARNSSRNPEAQALLFFQQAWFFGRRGRFAEAERAQHNLASLPETTMIAFATARACVAAYVAVVGDAPDKVSLAIDARNVAAAQGAIRWQRIAELLRAYAGASEEFSAAVKAVGSASPWNLTHLADIVASRLDELSETTYSAVLDAAQLHPARWRFVLRNRVDTAKPGEARRASVLLDVIGEIQDVGRLRGYARRQRRATGITALGRGLARRLAPRAFVEDQGQVSIHVGGRQVAGSSTRRKVLSLLCFLLSRPGMTSTRDQVLDAIWPDLDPVDALNSLNQTVYFLRRVLEEHYVDDLSPGYLHHDSDLIWLDTDLVGSRSHVCRRLIRDLPPAPAPEQVAELVNEYRGRFALDFEYEEWAAHYRDWLHASYLEIVERAVVSDLETGHFGRGIALARRVLEIDPTAESVEVSLLRLYRASGAHAAAAEQYGHYASQVREQLGVEPPALEDL